jgi:UDP-2,3-diacylglucosamine hydrolase
LNAMSSQHIGQLVVVREGVIVAVEAVEGSNSAIERGGALGGPGTVVVKFAKPDQDIRFDVPIVGLKTLETMRQVKASVLAVEAGRTLILDRQQFLEIADKNGITVVGCEPLVSL